MQVIIGIYLIYSAITGKGAAYKDENIKKEKKDEFKKMMRLFCAIFGPIALAAGGFEYLKMMVLSQVFYALFFIGIVLLFIYVFRITDRPKKAPKK